MKILITGAAGFIGSNIIDFLDNEGYDVIGCVRSQKKNDKFVVCDLEKEVLDFGIDVDVIIHTAAIYPFADTSFNYFFNSNIMATKNVIRYAKAKNIERIIYMSSVMSYGEINTVLREDSPHNNPNHYGLTKYVAEQLIKNSGIPYYIFILPGVVGKNCRDNWIMNTAQALYNNQKLSYYNGQGLFNNILHVKDLCQFIGKLLKKNMDGSETYLLGSSEMMIVEEVVYFIKDYFSSDSQLCNQEKRGSTYYLDVSKAILDGFTPKPIKDTLKIVCEEILRRNNS